MSPFRLLVSVLLCSALLLDVGCNEDPQRTGVRSDVDLTHFVQSWVHSYEEESDPNNWADQIYRPEESRQFPPSMFRHRYVFNKDGTCEWLVLHPTDAHYMAPGTWEAAPEDPNLISIFDTDGSEMVRFKILDLQPDFMRFESLMYRVPCFYCGLVAVLFRKEATSDEVEAFIRGVDLEYTIHHWGKVGVYGALVIFEVPNGTEEEWIERFQQEPLVESSFRPGETP